MQGVGEPQTMTTEGEVQRHVAVGLDLQSQEESVAGMRPGKRRLHPKDGGQEIEAERAEKGEIAVHCPGNEALFHGSGRQVEQKRLLVAVSRRESEGVAAGHQSRGRGRLGRQRRSRESRQHSTTQPSLLR